MKVTNHPVEIEGKTFMVQKRQRKEEIEDPPGTHLTKAIDEWSFDGGDTWHGLVVDAYKAALELGKLMAMGDPVTEGGEFEAFFLALVSELTALTPGERVKIVRTDTELVVVKEQSVLAVRASAIKDVDLQMMEEQHG